MGYWKSKVLPKIKKVFEKNPSKKAAIAEEIKSFDDSKEQIVKEIEEKEAELKPKVQEVYEASPDEIKTIIKEGKSDGFKKNSTEITKFIEELVKIEFPGSKKVQEAISKFGPVPLSGPILFIFEKVSTLIEVKKETAETVTTTETVTVTETVAIVEEKKEEVEVKVKEEKIEVAEKVETSTAKVEVKEEEKKP